MQNSSRHIRRCHRALKRGVRACLRLLKRAGRTSLNKRIGRWGERVVAKHLRGRGVRIIRMNWRAGGLEADILAVERKTIIVIEVKTRHNSLKTRYPALLAINRSKQRHLETLARNYLRNHGPLCRRLGVVHHRVDAVEVYYTANVLGFPRVRELRWHRGVSLTPYTA